MHAFIFTPGLWLGEGTIKISTSPENLKFFTKWNSTKREEKGVMVIETIQQVEILGVPQQLVNNLYFSKVSQTSFAVRLENESVTQVMGQGVLDDKMIAWEFRNLPNFDGFETYRLQPNDDYLMHAEYASADGFHRTVIEGRVWKKFA